MTADAAAAGIIAAAAVAAAAVAAALWSGRAARAARRALFLAQAEHLEHVARMETSGRLAADLAHDLNDLLTGIGGHAELLIVGMDAAAPGFADAREILALATGGARLTRPLRALDGRHRAPAAAPAETGSAVLVVEDEPGVRELIRAVLARAGHTVVAVDGPRAALAALARPPAIALMIVDLVMPEMGGYDLVDEARAANAGLPVIFISGFAADSTRQAAGDRFLAKPFSSEALSATVREALAATPPR